MCLCVALLGVGLCAPLVEGCKPGQVLSAFDDATGQIVEAQTTLDTIDARLAELALVPGVATAPAFMRARSALAGAREALRQAMAAIRSAKSAASAPDMGTIFVAFKDAWALLDDALRVVEALTGQKVGAVPDGGAADAGASAPAAIRLPAPSAAR